MISSNVALWRPTTRIRLSVRLITLKHVSPMWILMSRSSMMAERLERLLKNRDVEPQLSARAHPPPVIRKEEIKQKYCVKYSITIIRE